MCVFCVDLLFYYIVKLCRGDFRHSALHSVALPFSLLQRSLAKAVCHFTGAIFTRHHREIGGAFWLYSIFYQHALTFFGIYLYAQLGVTEGDSEGLSLYFVFGVLLTVCHVSFSLFLSTIPRTHDSTFSSTRTCAQACCANFLDAVNPGKKGDATQPGDARAIESTTNLVVPECKSRFFANDRGINHRRAFQVFKYPRKQWRKIEPKVREWLQENWDLFNSNDESGTFDWFTPKMAMLVPLDLIPPNKGGGARLDSAEGGARLSRRDDDTSTEGFGLYGFIRERTMLT